MLRLSTFDIVGFCHVLASDGLWLKITWIESVHEFTYHHLREIMSPLQMAVFMTIDFLWFRVTIFLILEWILVKLRELWNSSAIVQIRIHKLFSSNFFYFGSEFTNISLVTTPQNKRNWGRNKGWCKACFKKSKCTLITCLASKLKSNELGNLKLNIFEHSRKKNPWFESQFMR